MRRKLPPKYEVCGLTPQRGPAFLPSVASVPSAHLPPFDTHRLYSFDVRDDGDAQHGKTRVYESQDMVRHGCGETCRRSRIRLLRCAYGCPYSPVFALVYPHSGDASLSVSVCGVFPFFFHLFHRFGGIL